MIRIKKPIKPPAIFQTKGEKAIKELGEQYDANSDAYKGWTFDSRIYGATSVKTALRKAQHDKCAFCESKVTHIAYGDVEHFRPKAGYRQHLRAPLAQPGYYWLAYDWSNLLFSCQICNQRHKRNYFPLVDAKKRARSHHDDVTEEQPLFIHPAEEDPHEFLEFNEEYLRPIGGNKRGEVTIEVLGLNRELIAERRRDVLAVLQPLIEIRELLASEFAKEPNPKWANQIAAIDGNLNQCTSDSGEYAAMVRALMKKSALSTQ